MDRLAPAECQERQNRKQRGGAPQHPGPHGDFEDSYFDNDCAEKYCYRTDNGRFRQTQAVKIHQCKLDPEQVEMKLDNPEHKSVDQKPVDDRCEESEANELRHAARGQQQQEQNRANQEQWQTVVTERYTR
jgi:hypothetical protein